MNNNISATTLTQQPDLKSPLQNQVQEILASQQLGNQKRLITELAAELDISVLECAAALLCLNAGNSDKKQHLKAVIGNPSPSALEKRNEPMPQPGIRLVRYRLDLGSGHNVTLEQLKKVLVDESGVDVKNIANVRILDGYTLIDLPDEMPQEIFHHLKMVEINGQKLAIRRVKARNKKRGNRRHRHARSGYPPSSKEVSQ
jgi:DbpA RNA binding domain